MRTRLLLAAALLTSVPARMTTAAARPVSRPGSASGSASTTTGGRAGSAPDRQGRPPARAPATSRRRGSRRSWRSTSSLRAGRVDQRAPRRRRVRPRPARPARGRSAGGGRLPGAGGGHGGAGPGRRARQRGRRGCAGPDVDGPFDELGATAGLDIVGGQGQVVASRDGGIALDAVPDGRLQVFATDEGGSPTRASWSIAPDATTLDAGEGRHRRLSGALTFA